MDSKVIYGRSYGFIWLCAPCKAYCGVHRNSADHAPLGTLANEELRRLRKRLHRIFDPLWTSGKYTRNQAYRMLSDALGGIKKKECHIGMFDERRCREAIEKLGGGR